MTNDSSQKLNLFIDGKPELFADFVPGQTRDFKNVAPGEHSLQLRYYTPGRLTKDGPSYDRLYSATKVIKVVKGESVVCVVSDSDFKEFKPDEPEYSKGLAWILGKYPKR